MKKKNQNSGIFQLLIFKFLKKPKKETFNNGIKEKSHSSKVIKFQIEANSKISFLKERKKN